MYHADDIVLLESGGEASNLRATGVVAGDQVRLDNRAYLAYCFYYLHHVMDFEEWAFLSLDGVPIYPQHDLPTMSPFMGVPYSGQYEGKLMWIHHTHDASLWPPQGIAYRNAVERAQGIAGRDENFRLRWTENAEHVPAALVPSQPGRSSSTWLIDYRPVIEQCLADLTAWVEDGVAPQGSSFSYADGSITLPDTAAERGGIQPVLSVTANGSIRAEVKVGEPVRLEVTAEVPPGAGTFVAVAWDLDGSGAYAHAHDDIDGSETRLVRSMTHHFDEPGTYFATAIVHSHREGDVNATARRIPNLAAARVVVH